MKHTSALDCMAHIVSLLRQGAYSAEELAEIIDTNTVTIRGHMRALHKHGVAYVSGLTGSLGLQKAVWSFKSSPDLVDIDMPGYTMAITFKVPHPPRPPRVRKPRVKVKVEKPPKPPKEPKPKVKRVRKSRAKPKELHKVRASKARVWPPGPPRAASIFQLGDIMKESMQCEN